MNGLASSPRGRANRRAAVWTCLALAGPILFSAEPPPGLKAATGRLSSGGYALWFAGTEWLQPAESAPPRPARAAPRLANLDPKIGPNLRLGEDPPELPATRRAQAEPHVARSVTDTNLILATFQEGRFEDGGAVNCGYAVSHDGGQTWRRALIPHLVTTGGDGEFDRASDPVAGVDLEGRLYLNTLALRSSGGRLHSTIVVSRSEDGGATFSRPLIAAATTNPDVLLDKNWMAINTFAASPAAGRIAVTFTRFDSSAPNGTVTPIAVTLSDDRGESWSEPRIISPPNCQGSQPVFLPDGSLAVVYWNFAGAAGNQIEVVHSPDGGVTFGPPRVITPVLLHADAVARDGAFLPGAAADRHLGVLYVTYQGRQGQRPVIFFTRSRDRGDTWTAPRAINDTPGDRSVFNAAIAASPDGQHVTVVFYDKRHDDGSGRWADLYLAESFDGGDTWQPNLRLSAASSDLSRAPLSPGGRMVGDYQGVVPALNFGAPAVAVWVDARFSSPDPYAVTITRTRGTSFEAWQRLAFRDADLLTAAVGSADADPDGDRLPNRLEYLLGLPPLSPNADPVQSQRPALPGSLTLALEPLVTATDAELLWRESADLRQWSPAAAEAVIEAPGQRPESRAREFRFELRGTHRFFAPGAR